MTISADEVPLAFDLKLMRPGCVLLQACMGGSVSAAQQFASETWLLAPTPDMVVYKIPKDLLPDIIKKVETLHANESRRPGR